MNDLKYTLCGPGTAWPLIGAIDVSSDGLTATVHFTQPLGGWLGWLTSAILPQHYMSTIPVAQAAAQSYPASAAVVGAPVSGPFTVKSISSGEIEYVRNPDFAAGVSPAHQGPAYLDALASTPAAVGTVEQTPLWSYEHFDLNNDPTHARGNGLWSVAVRQGPTWNVEDWYAKP